MRARSVRFVQQVAAFFHTSFDQFSDIAGRQLMTFCALGGGGAAIVKQ